MAKSVKILVEKLKDEGWAVRSWAAWSLGELGDKVAVPYLIKALDDEDEGVRSDVAWSLGLLGDKMAVPALIKSLGDENRSVCYYANEALNKLGVNNEKETHER